MQAVILAAGMGSRLGKYTRNATKCMVEIDGKTLLERVFDSLRNVNIHNVVIVTGYCADVLEKHALSVGSDLDITFVRNEKYASTNNIYSLYLASEYMMKDDTVLFESDLVFDLSIVGDIVSSPDPDIVAVSRFESWMDGTVTTFDKDKFVTAFIDKSNFIWDDCSKYYKTVNIYKLSKDFYSKWYHPFIEAYIRTCGNNAYYEMVLKIITNINVAKLKALDITGKKWYEIDTPQDLLTARTLFGKNKLKQMSERFGGFWRFNDIHDYCYLVNPWFPSERMISEMKYSFEALLSGYPSGQRIITSAMASFLEINEEYTVAGNGSAELIRAVMSSFSGSCYITLPSFNEYNNSICDADVRFGYCSENNFSYGSEFILSRSEGTDMAVIINPDNPSGNFIKKNEMIYMLDAFHKRRQQVIVDESFADFADKDLRYSLISDDILEKYPNLIVIKSISKSYGVPGLRLGVLCSSDKDKVKRINKMLPIWNINSFAEFFLQIIGKYKKEYIVSCDHLVKARHSFIDKLKNTGITEVFPTQANYIMCRLQRGTSEALANYLLEHKFYIKCLNSKKGCEGGEYIRLAVRTEEENDELAELIGLFGSEWR